MAEPGPSLVDFTVTNRPPSGRVQNVCSSGFQYRGKMFSGLHEKKEEKTHQKCSLDNADNSNPTTQIDNLYSNGLSYRRKVHSAKGRLEINANHKISKQAERNIDGLHSSDSLVHNNDKSTASIIDLNTISSVPDYEEQMLINAANKRAMAYNQTTDLLTTVAIRPSSAKGSVGSPVVKVDGGNHSGISNGIKPSVYGLRMGRQVYGSEPEIMEAWKDIDKEFPYKLSEQDSERQDVNALSGHCSMPSTLKPLCHWLQKRVPSSIIGLDSSSCFVFLSHDYQHTDLPEMPPPLDPTDDLPYKCVVETPREPEMKHFNHPSIDKEDAGINWKCKHSGIVKPSYNGDISNLLEKPYKRSPEKIRKEIQELEDLMHGVGSLASNCSFVQFQAEITQSKELAAKLYKLRPRDEQEPVDTFGLLKIYKDHELILAALQQRRNDCIHELALLERDF